MKVSGCVQSKHGESECVLMFRERENPIFQLVSCGHDGMRESFAHTASTTGGHGKGKRRGIDLENNLLVFGG